MSVRPSVGWSVGEHESKCVKTHISAPAHLSATGGRVSGLVFFSKIDAQSLGGVDYKILIFDHHDFLRCLFRGLATLQETLSVSLLVPCVFMYLMLELID